MKKIFISIFFIPLALFSASNLDFYMDGISDAYTQITREISQGLSERKMREYRNKFLVILDVDDKAISDIIFYKTVGTRASLPSVVVKNRRNKKNYIVFSAYSRKADALNAKRKLMSYGIVASVIRGSGESFVRNPMIVKNFINVMKMQERKRIKKAKLTKEQKHQKKVLKYYGAYGKELLVLRRNICTGNGFIHKGGIHIAGKNYKRGDSIGNFKVASIKKVGSNFSAILEDPDEMVYRLSKLDCKNIKKHQKNIKKEDRIAQKKEETPKTLTNHDKNEDNGVYVCDFRKLRTAKNIDMKPIKLSDTTYFGKNFNVYAKKTGNGYWKVRHSGAEILNLSEHYFEKICKKK